MQPCRARSPAHRYSKANNPLPSELMQMIDDRRRDAELNDPRIGWPNEMYGRESIWLMNDQARLMGTTTPAPGTPNFGEVWLQRRDDMHNSEEYRSYSQRLHARGDAGWGYGHEHMRDSPTRWKVDLTEPPLVRLARETEPDYPNQRYKMFAPSVTPLAWLAIPAAIGTKLAYDRYFGPEETKKAAELRAPYYEEMIDYMAHDMTRGDFPGDDQTVTKEYYKEKTLAWKLGLRDGYSRGREF